MLSQHSDGSLPIFEKLVEQNQPIRRKMSHYEYENFVLKEAQKKYKYNQEESDIRSLIEKKRYLALTTEDMIKYSQPKEFLEYKKQWRRKLKRDNDKYVSL